MLAIEPSSHLESVFPNEEAIRLLAGEVAGVLVAGDVVALSGGLGSGKTAFARALIRHLAGNPDLEVPSPTFTLLQTYDLPGLRLVHLDLYRIGDQNELVELGLDELMQDAVVLVEWPERATAQFPGKNLC